MERASVPSVETRDDRHENEPAADRQQIVERLLWTPRERLQYLLDMLAFEERAHRARPVTRRR